MKRIFFFGVIAYSVAILVLNDLGMAVNQHGTQALPWMIKVLIDICFVGAGVFAIYGSSIQWDDEEEGIHPDDVKVPSTWLYGLFFLNLFGNFCWHGYEFAMENDFLSFYNGCWWVVEFIAMGLTGVLFKHAQQIARREARRLRTVQGMGGRSV